jgi:hypothetical protein
VKGAKHVVSVSLGSSKRVTDVKTTLLGHEVHLERIGTDGELSKAAALIRELDGKVDAIGLGGIDLFVIVGGRRYYVRDALKLARNARQTPVVCGAGLKDTLERFVVGELEGLVGWSGRKVLLTSGADRFGMAEALAAHGAEVVFGDLIFLLGLPAPIRSLKTLDRSARLLGPLVVNLPFTWLYPTGDKQESTQSGRGRRYFAWAEAIAGDFHFLRRYMPARLDGKVILTNTTTSEDVELLRARGAKTLVTTTPRFSGRSLATNLLEAAFVAVAGKHPLTPEDYRNLIREAKLEPDVLELNP